MKEGIKLRQPSIVLLLLLLMATLPAQSADTPTLADILQKLEKNLDHYDTSVPSFFCDEHIVSQVTPGPRNQDTTTDSIFRLRRSITPDGSMTLDESREIKTVNGNPPTSQDIAGPSLVSGAFEGGLAVVSLNQQACMRYTLEHPKQNRTQFIIDFATQPHPEKSGNCLLQEAAKGRASIDPSTMQITRMEMRVSHHVIFPGDFRTPRITAEWLLTVDYMPVSLDNQTFWMPSSITSRDTSGGGTFHPTVWSYKATYRNYHKVEVTSRIVPSGNAR